MGVNKIFISTAAILLTIIIGIGTTGRLASANDAQCLFAEGEDIYSATFSIWVGNTLTPLMMSISSVRPRILVIR